MGICPLLKSKECSSKTDEHYYKNWCSFSGTLNEDGKTIFLGYGWPKCGKYKQLK